MKKRAPAEALADARRVVAEQRDLDSEACVLMHAETAFEQFLIDSLERLHKAVNGGGFESGEP